MRPFGFTSYYDTHKSVLKYNLEGTTVKIRCSVPITEPANEAYWPGQSRQLYDLLASPKELVDFSESDGADLHCKPKGTGLRDLRVFDWPCPFGSSVQPDSRVAVQKISLSPSTGHSMSDLAIGINRALDWPTSGWLTLPSDGQYGR
jgi:hypothetical protein